MTAAIAGRLITGKLDYLKAFERGVGAGVQIFKGTLIAPLSTGYLVPAGTAGALDVIGISDQHADNRTGAAGAITCRGTCGVRVFDNNGDSVTIADVGNLCYVVDNQTVDRVDGTGRRAAGVVVDVDSLGVHVLLSPLTRALTYCLTTGVQSPIIMVRGASTANVANLASVPALQDGVAHVEGDRILLKDQSSADENGVYVYGAIVAGSGALTRAADVNEDDEALPGMIVAVSEGTVSADKNYQLTTNAPIVVGTTSLTFAKMIDAPDLASVASGLGAALVGSEDAGGHFAGTTVEAILQEIGATTGAGVVGIADAGDFTSATDVEGATQEIYQDLLSSNSHIDVPFTSGWFEIDGSPLDAFTDGASNTPGLALDGSEGAGVRWNNAAAPDPICRAIPVPYDLDESQDVTLSVIGWKSGATLADAVTFEIGVFNNIVGALYDADVNYGGTSSAFTGDAAAKTIQAATLTLLAANLPDPDAAHAQWTVTLRPTDGTIGTDDVTIGFLRIAYTRKLRTS